MIAAGVGCRRGAPAPDIEAAIRAALARANIAPDALDVIATIEAKSAEAGIRDGGGKTRRRRRRRAGDGPHRRERAASKRIRNACSRSRASARSPKPPRSPRLDRAANADRARVSSSARRHARSPLRAPDAGSRIMTVHFIGAGPGAADLITVRGRDLIARCPVCLYAGSIVPRELLELLPARRAHRRHGAAVARRDRAPSSSRRTPPATTSRGFIPAISRSIRRSPSSCAGSRGAAFLTR